MTVTLVAPISEADYNSYPLLKLPTGYTGDAVTTLLNNAWQILTAAANQPLTETESTDIYDFPSRYCNQTPAGYVEISPRYTPLISVTSIKWSTSIVNAGWITTTKYDVINTGNFVRSYDLPFSRGGYGLVQVVYNSGYATIPDDLKEGCALMAAMLLSAGFVPTSQGSALMPDWVDGADRSKWYRVKQIIELHKRVR